MTVHSASQRPAPGNVTLVVLPTRVRLVLSGELDLQLKDELVEAVREAADHDRPVDVDVREVTFMDSSALAALSRLIHLAGHRPTFLSPPPMVRFLLDVTRIGELVDIVDESGRTSAAPAAERTSPGPSPA